MLNVKANILSTHSFIDLGVKLIIDGYQQGKWTPIQIAHLCMDQFNQLDKKYKAWQCFNFEKLFEQAAVCSNRLDMGQPPRILEGIPIGVKDIFNTLDFPTQMGSPIWSNFMSGNDARAVFNLKRAGAVIPGKTVTAEFAVHSLNKTLNPHDFSKTPGTSSSGSACAVATGMIPVALGTQTAGSIIRPASFCGVYGCKPSFGLIPRTGMLKTTDSLDTVGFFVSRAADLRVVFNAIRVHGSDYPISHSALHDLQRQQKKSGRPWQVGLVKTYLWDQMSSYAQEALLQWANKLALQPDIEVIEADLSDEMECAHDTHATIYNCSLAYYFQEEAKKSELVSPIMSELVQIGSSITSAQYMGALNKQQFLCHLMDSFMQRFDVIISLSTAGEAPPREIIETFDSCLIWTLSHLAVVGAPAFCSPNRLPFGLQLVARRYNDYLLFNFIDYLLELDMLPKGPNPLI